MLLVAVDASGHVTGTSIRQSSGHPVLDRAALQAVQNWRFEPARREGLAVAAQVEVPVRFRFAG
jgi:protein TonB